MTETAGWIVHPGRDSAMLFGISDTRSLGGMVATDWTAVGLATLGVAGTLGGGFVGAWTQARSQERMTQRQQRDQAAEVVGDAYRLLIESAPDRLWRKDVATLWGDFYAALPRFDAIRVQLWMLAVRHPDDSLGTLVNGVNAAIAETLTASAKYASARITDADSREGKEEAKEAFSKAQDLIHELIGAIHR